MKKRIEILLIMFCLLSFSGCTYNNEELTPTGYPSDEVQRPQIMYNGVIYFYTADGFDHPLPDGYEQVGEVKEVDNRQEPVEDWCGSRVEVGRKYMFPMIQPQFMWSMRRDMQNLTLLPT